RVLVGHGREEGGILGLRDRGRKPRNRRRRLAGPRLAGDAGRRCQADPVLRPRDVTPLHTPLRSGSAALAAEPEDQRSLGEARQSYCVCTATLVRPRVAPLASLKRTKMRDAAGFSGTACPIPFTNTANVAVPLAPIVSVTLPAAVPMQEPLESVWQIESPSGNTAVPGSGEALDAPAPPALLTATRDPPLPPPTTLPIP